MTKEKVARVELCSKARSFPFDFAQGRLFRCALLRMTGRDAGAALRMTEDGGQLDLLFTIDDFTVEVASRRRLE